MHRYSFQFLFLENSFTFSTLSLSLLLVTEIWNDLGSDFIFLQVIHCHEESEAENSNCNNVHHGCEVITVYHCGSFYISQLDDHLAISMICPHFCL